MLKRITAMALAMVMTLTLFNVGVFARYENKNNYDYDYPLTEDLRVDVVGGSEIVATWPAVDKSGNLINANPLRADGQENSNGCPTAGWTNPTQGMIIAYPNWQADGQHTQNPTQVNTGEAQILYGVTDRKTDIPLVIMDGAAGSTAKVKDAYLDTTVVAENFATLYKIEYSKDGVEWKLDHEATTINHGKKLRRPAEDGTSKEDGRNTFFLENQLYEQLIGSYEADTEYMLRVTASNAANKSESFKVFETKFTTPKPQIKYPAFPTVEGGGKYSQGGRGTDTRPADIYVVTNLTDSVTNPQPGSLRYGLERKYRTDGNNTYPVIITFAVGGVINIDPDAAKNARRLNIGSNTTILGQTAPGEGITVYGASAKFDGTDIIARYIRFRLGEGYDQDAASATGSNIVIDHCTFSWGVDECFSAKEIINSSIQYNIIASSLSFPNKTGIMNGDNEVAAGESEAKHGMGSIINGSDVSYTHNLWANHGTRNPRFEGGFSYASIDYDNKLEFSNNVIYNWGHNSGYGGERGPNGKTGNGKTNMIGNYYKPGNNTLEKVNTRIFDVDGSSYYFKDNVMTSSADVTADNKLGFYEISDSRVLSAPAELAEPYSATSAEDAYKAVIDGVGASYVRDAQDTRLIRELETGTGRFINNEFEAGGIGTLDAGTAPKDTDSDGIPDEWESAHGLDPNNKADAAAIVTDETKSYLGYTNIEVYANDLLGEWDESTKPAKAEAPKAEITAINENGQPVGDINVNVTLAKGRTYTITKNAGAGNYSILLNDKVIAENKDEFVIPADTAVGTYTLSLSVKGDTGSNISTVIPVTVVEAAQNGNLDGFTSADIGDVRAKGADYYDSKTNTLVSEGAGHIGILATSSNNGPDAFHFNYKQVKGDFTFTAKVENLAKLDYYQQSGLMVRAGLEPTAEFYMPSLTYIKGEDYEGSTDVTGGFVKAKNIRAVYRSRSTADSNVSYGGASSMLGIPAVRVDKTPNTGYARIERSGQHITLLASLDGSKWYTVGEYETTLPETAYVGFATDAAQDYMTLTKYNATQFSNIELVNGNRGDADGDGEITVKDTDRVLEYVLSPETSDMTEEQIENCKVSGNDKLTSADVAQILQKVLDSSYGYVNVK